MKYRDRFNNAFIRWISDLWEFVSISLCIIIPTVIGILIVVALLSIVDYNSCQEYSKLGIDTVWNFWTGCMANHPTFGWIPTEEYFKILNVNIP